MRASCRYEHATPEQEAEYKRTGVLPTLQQMAEMRERAMLAYHQQPPPPQQQQQQPPPPQQQQQQYQQTPSQSHAAPPPPQQQQQAPQQQPAAAQSTSGRNRPRSPTGTGDGEPPSRRVRREGADGGSSSSGSANTPAGADAHALPTDGAATR